MSRKIVLQIDGNLTITADDNVSSYDIISSLEIRNGSTNNKFTVEDVSLDYSVIDSK